MDLSKIKMVMMDVDGVLTDGTITFDDEGREFKHFNAKDGVGIKYLGRAGLLTVFLTGRRSAAAEVRAKELGVTELAQNARNKLEAYARILEKYRLGDVEICYVGDDLPDLPVMRRVGWAVAVADAVPEVRDVAAYVTRAPGGKGAVREVAEMLLKAQGKWQQIIARYAPGESQQ